MNGLLYKEFRQNRGVMIAIAVTPLVTLILLPVFAFTDFSQLSGFSLAKAWADINDVPLVRLLMLLIGALIIGFTVSLIFNADESKKWSFFAATLPGSAQKAIYTKYVFTFMVLAMYYLSQLLWEMVLTHVCWGAWKIEMSSLSTVFSMLFFVQLLLRAIEMPFFVRFGVKRGSTVKVIMIWGLLFLVMLWFLFGPLPDSFDALLDGIASLVFGPDDVAQNSKLMDNAYLALGFLPYVAVIAYVISYKISCKCYMKGAEQYEK